MTIHDAIQVRQKETPPPVSPTEQKMAMQAQSNWIRSHQTAKVFEAIGKEIEELEAQARNFAVTYHEHNNHQQIIQRLIRADELRKIIKTYGRISDS